MPATNVKSSWSGGDLYFYDYAGNEIFNIDGTNRNMEFPASSTLNLKTGSVFTVAGQLTASVPVRSQSVSLPASADGIVTITAYSQTIYITKAGVCALTLADPTATTHDGTRLTFMSTTANAHTVSNAAGSGFNGAGSGSDVATFGAAVGNNLTVEAYQGKWYVIGTSVGITLG